jgi:hypothetical protein
MPLTGPIPEGETFFCPHCGALYAELALKGQLAMTISSSLAHLLLHSIQRGPSARWCRHM